MSDREEADKQEPDLKVALGNSSWPTRLWRWFDARTGADQLLHKSLDEPVPGGARFAYVFGSALLFIFISQVITGLCLAVYYVPSPLTSHVTLAYIIKDVAGGAFLRSLHSYGSSAMIVVLVLHFLQTFLYGSYKGRRELLWISGCVLSLLVLGMTFTGYLLRWDLKAYFSGAVGTNLVGDVPLIGGWLLRLMRGGPMMGALTLSRFYVLHLFILPATIFLFVAVHIFMFRKAGAAGPMREDPVHPRMPTESFYPKQVIIDMAFVLVVMGVLGMLAHFVPVELGPVADPSNSNYLPRPEWYYLPFFEWLKFWEGARTVVGVILIPGILIGLVFALPFLDRSLERRPWKRPIPVGAVSIILIALIGLGMQSRLDDSRDPTTAAQIAQQDLEEDNYFHSPFHLFSDSAASGGAAPLALSGAAAQGKTLFDSHGCNGCHGVGGAGGVGPALTHISEKFPPAQLTILLKEPSAKMKAGGMVPLTLNAADMTALVAYVSSLGGASAPAAAALPASASASPAPAETSALATAIPARSPATAAPRATAGAPKPQAGSSIGAQTATGGKGIFVSQRCGGCHGASGGGGVGPPLTHISSQYPPARLTAVLKAPTAKMKAAGMVPLTLSVADMKALVSYVTNLGGKSATSAATPPASSTSPAPGKAEPSATTGASKAAPAATPQADGSTAPAPSKTEVGATAAPAKATTGSAAGAATAAGGKGIFDSQHCSTCHGASGGGGSGPALTSISSQYPPAQLTAVLKAPTAKMKAAGMVALTLNDADMEALVSYVTSLGGPSTAAAATPPASGEPPTAPSKAEPAAVTGPSTAPTGSSTGDASAAQGKAIFESQRCSTCHGATGGGGSGPALTHISSQYPPDKLTAVLKAPTAKMEAAGMTPLTLDAADMKALVSYVTSLGGKSATTTEVTRGQYAQNKQDVRIRSAAYPSAIRKDYRIFAVKCNQCHNLDKSLQAGGSPAQAVAEVKRMQSMASSQINDDQAKAVVDFLNYNREHVKP